MSQELYHSDAQRQHPVYPVPDEVFEWPTAPPSAPTPDETSPNPSPRYDHGSEAQARQGRASGAARRKRNRPRDTLIRYHLYYLKMSVRATARSLKVNRGVVERVKKRINPDGTLQMYCGK